MALVLFDLDGTLIDPEAGITRSFEHTLQALDVEPPSPEILRSSIGPPLHTSFSSVLGDDAARSILQGNGARVPPLRQLQPMNGFAL